MITRITLDNMYDENGGKKEFIIPSNFILNRYSTIEEWEKFDEKVEVIRKVKDIFRYKINMIQDSIKHSPLKESTLEIQMKWEEKIYNYSMVFYESELVMETLLVDQSWVFSRLKDNPDFVLDSSYLNDVGKIDYKKHKGLFSSSFLYCFEPGEELLREIQNIIIVDDWMKLGHFEFIRKFETIFNNLSYNKIINEMISQFGFSEDYEKLEEDNETLVSSIKPDIKLRLELAGSGFLRLSRLYPLMIASKKEGLMMIATDPYDLNLHPVLGRALMKWFLKDNPNPPIGKLTNIVL